MDGWIGGWMEDRWVQCFSGYMRVCQEQPTSTTNVPHVYSYMPTCLHSIHGFHLPLWLTCLIFMKILYWKWASWLSQPKNPQNCWLQVCRFCNQLRLGELQAGGLPSKHERNQFPKYSCKSKLPHTYIAQAQVKVIMPSLRCQSLGISSSLSVDIW